MVSGGGRTVTYGQLVGGKLFNATHRGDGLAAAPGRRRSRSRSTSSSARARRASTSRRRSRATTRTSTRPRTGHAPRPPRAAARPGRRTATGRRDRCRSTRARSRTSRARRSSGRATSSASSRRRSTTRSRPPRSSRSRGRRTRCCRATATSWDDARRRTRAGKTTRHGRVSTGNVDAALASAAKVVCATYTYGVQQPRPDRPDVLRSPTCTPNGAVIYTNGAGQLRGPARVAAVARPARERGALHLLRGRRLVRRPPARYDAPPAGALMSQLAGAPVRAAVHALGRAGLGRLRPELAAGHPRGIDAKGKITAFETTAVVPGRGPREVRETTEEPLGMTLTTAQIQSTIGGGIAGGDYYSIAEPARHQQGDPVQHRRLPRSRRRSARRPRPCLGVEIDDRRARLRGRHGPDRVPPPEHVIGDELSATWIRSSRQAGRELGDARGRRRSSRTATSSTAAASRRPAKTGAVVAEIAVNKKTGKITVPHMYGVQDVGLAISPGLCRTRCRAASCRPSAARARGHDLQQEARDGARLRHLPDPALQGRARR